LKVPFEKSAFQVLRIINVFFNPIPALRTFTGRLIGLLAELGGLAIGYDIFEGEIYEGHTLIPSIVSISA